MSRRITDEELIGDPLLARLREHPAPNKKLSEARLAAIQREVAEPMRTGRSARKMWIGWTAAVVGLIALCGAFVYAYDRPGGIGDWRYSRAAGYKETISIPLGRTPEEAVMKFRQYPQVPQFIYRVDIDGGVLLFVKRAYQDNSTGLQIEFVRHNWLGWKWVMGGGYGLSAFKEDNVALDYMSMPKFPGTRSPFPIMIGQIQNAAVSNVDVSFGGPDAGTLAAEVVEYEPGKKLWYAALPKSASSPYKISALGAAGEVVASHGFDDVTDTRYIVKGSQK